jgi:hypothetical protein
LVYAVEMRFDNAGIFPLFEETPEEALLGLLPSVSTRPGLAVTQAPEILPSKRMS